MGKRGPKPRRKEVIWTPELAYAVGLITTDGCLSPDGRHLLLTSKDLEQVQNLKSILGVKANTGVVYSGARRPYHRLQWGDVVLYNFFLDIGLTPNKSLTLGEVAVPDVYFFDFLRGHHDGDGCFYSYFDPRWKSSYMFYLCFASASKNHLLWLRKVIHRLLGVQGSLSGYQQKNKPNGFHQLKFAKTETRILLRRLYPDAEVACLSRKRLKIEKALGIVGLSLLDS